MNAADEVRLALDRAAARLRLSAVIDAAATAALLGAALALPVALVGRFLTPTWPWWLAALVPLIAAGLAAGRAWTAEDWPRLAARWFDQHGKLQSRATTGLDILRRGQASPWDELLLAETAPRLTGLTLTPQTQPWLRGGAAVAGIAVLLAIGLWPLPAAASREPSPRPTAARPEAPFAESSSVDRGISIEVRYPSPAARTLRPPSQPTEG